METIQPCRKDKKLENNKCVGAFMYCCLLCSAKMRHVGWTNSEIINKHVAQLFGTVEYNHCWDIEQCNGTLDQFHF